MELIEEDNDFSIYDFNSIINYVKNNFIQILLLCLVIFIIYTVEHISNINAMIMTPVSYINTQVQAQRQLQQQLQPQKQQQQQLQLQPRIKYSKGRKISKN
jgi:hypothetical protein